MQKNITQKQKKEILQKIVHKTNQYYEEILHEREENEAESLLLKSLKA